MSFILNGFSEYKSQLEKYSLYQQQYKTGDLSFTAVKDGEGESYVVVIGESLNKQHMSIYGYNRDTTPRMRRLYEEKKLLRFVNAFSSHTHTMQTLQMAFTSANQLNNNDYYHSPSIINVLNLAEIETYWISNQVRYGMLDNYTTLMAESAKHKFYLNGYVGDGAKTTVFDGAVIASLDSVLQSNADRNRVIFVHLMGSHIGYCSRFPSEQEYVFPSDIPGDLSSERLRSIECYDNSVLYNDSVVVGLIETLAKIGGVSGLVYFSDHADDVVSGLAHQSDLFTYEMTQIPLLVWLSPEYRDKQKDKIDNMNDHQEEYFSNDLMFDFLLGLVGVKSDVYNPIFDLTSSRYELRPEQLLTLHGKKKYAVPENKYYNP
jgi:glucan phosphoethanolaminetransferase (alkaline phosphatase superfamily)